METSVHDAVQASEFSKFWSRSGDRSVEVRDGGLLDKAGGGIGASEVAIDIRHTDDSRTRAISLVSLYAERHVVVHSPQGRKVFSRCSQSLHSIFDVSLLRSQDD